MASHALLPLPWLASCVCVCMVAVALLAPPPAAAASHAARAPVRGGDPTVGFTEVKLTDREQLRAAAPLRRAERRPGYDYSSGVWQFEGYGYVPSGTTGESIMQVFGAGATTLMLHVYDGALRYYDRQVVEDGAYDRWFRLNVVHDVGVSTMM
ncbi:unnamed protein product [Miscanthus lutarioriparius]|uniref:Uncharacterized protein n=1 Tax=Miscanthus lutarioriparius TaxID=422564 RepID=A0A811RE08_9POAL|nr:unnamed protein product [Miscanthus lutarioriparius]